MRFLLDTAFLIDHMRGDAGARRRMADLWANATAIYVSEIVVCELMAGLAAADVPSGEALLRPLEFIQPGPESALAAGRWRAEARRPRRGWRPGCRSARRAARDQTGCPAPPGPSRAGRQRTTVMLAPVLSPSGSWFAPGT